MRESSAKWQTDVFPIIMYSEQLIILWFVFPITYLAFWLSNLYKWAFGPELSRSWQDLNAPCVFSGSAVAPPASPNQWGQWATVALCGADGRRMALPPTVAHCATYKWVSSHHWPHNIMNRGVWCTGAVHQGVSLNIFLRSWDRWLTGW